MNTLVLTIHYEDMALSGIHLAISSVTRRVAVLNYSHRSRNCKSTPPKYTRTKSHPIVLNLYTEQIGRSMTCFAPRTYARGALSIIEHHSLPYTLWRDVNRFATCRFWHTGNIRRGNSYMDSIEENRFEAGILGVVHSWCSIRSKWGSRTTCCWVLCVCRFKRPTRLLW